MKFMSISGMFAPFFGGGAEFSSYNLAKWLRNQGHEVGVLTTAPTPDDVMNGELYEGLQMWRIYMPRPYSIHKLGKKWQKPIWHFQDHFDPANRKIAAKVFDEFKPDFVNIHILQGLGHNVIKEIAKRDIPALYFHHDLGLVCIKRSMFSKGKECIDQCIPCKFSCQHQERIIRKVPRITICSPSQANLDKIGKSFPLNRYHSKAILNANSYPKAKTKRVESRITRLLYVGRLDVTKGVDLLIDICKNLSKNYEFTLTIVGDGPDKERLQNIANNLDWCKFTGHVNQEEVSNYMANSEVLLIPSLWAENSPGVVINALTKGLPVIGSNKGGIPELIENNKNGQLVEAGNKKDWELALKNILDNPKNLKNWRDYAIKHAKRFSQDNLAKNIYKAIEETIARTSDNKK